MEQRRVFNTVRATSFGSGGVIMLPHGLFTALHATASVRHVCIYRTCPHFFLIQFHSTRFVLIFSFLHIQLYCKVLGRNSVKHSHWDCCKHSAAMTMSSGILQLRRVLHIGHTKYNSGIVEWNEDDPSERASEWNMKSSTDPPSLWAILNTNAFFHLF